MTVEALDHINIRTPDITGTSRFFADLLVMEIRPSPGVDDPALGAWICDAAGRAVVHVAAQTLLYPWEMIGTPAVSGLGSSRIHHVALRCAGYDAMRQRLEARGQPFQPNDVPEVGLRQLFVEEPNGILLELNFFGE